MNRPATLALGWAAALAVALVFSGLGGWQLARMHDKEAMLAAAQGVLASRQPRPLALAALPDRARDYDWAAGDGRFAAVPPVLLDNQRHNGRIGVRAYRVFEPVAPGAPPLLVELGWLPLQGNRQMPPVPRIEGLRRVAGLLSPPPAPGLAAPPPVARDDGTLLATALEPAVLGPALSRPGLALRVLRLDPADPLGFERDLRILPNTVPPERHLGYAVQWFALAAAVLVIALVLTLRRRRVLPRTPGTA